MPIPHAGRIVLMILINCTVFTSNYCLEVQPRLSLREWRLLFGYSLSEHHSTVTVRSRLTLKTLSRKVLLSYDYVYYAVGRLARRVLRIAQKEGSVLCVSLSGCHCLIKPWSYCLCCISGFQEEENTSECRLGVWGHMYLFICIQMYDTHVILFLRAECQQASLSPHLPFQW